MTRLQINLNFLRLKPDGVDELATGLLSKLATSVDREASHLERIEIALDGKSIFNSENHFPGGKGQKLRIGEYLLDPKDVLLNVTINEATQPHDTVEKEEKKTTTQYRFVEAATGDFVPNFPDSEEKEYGHRDTLSTSATATTTGSAATTTGSAEENDEQMTDDAVAARDSAAREAKACGGSKSASKSHKFEVATLMAKCQNRKKDGGVQTTPRYLIRFGAPITTSHKMPLAWPPMTDYKCAITFIEKSEVEGDSPQKWTVYIILMDGDDNVGIVYQRCFTPTTDYPLDIHMVFHLHNATSWLMQRPLIVVAESVARDFSASHSKVAGGYKTLEQFIKEELSHCKDWVHICRDPMLATMFKSLVFCK